MNRRATHLLLFALGFSNNQTFGAWTDRSAGLPPMESTSARTMGGQGDNVVLLHDNLGRLFVGSNSLLVFDGQAWQSFSTPDHEALTALALDENGTLWAGTTNNLGYFEEEPLGIFKFHSLLPHLPEELRNVRHVWGCAAIGQVTYFIGRDKLFRWDGNFFQVTTLETKSRLSLLKLGDEWWIHHPETGLYRLKQAAPVLEIPAASLQNFSIRGLFQDESGVVAVGDHGFVRPGGPPVPFSQPDLNDYLLKHRVTSLVNLPNGNLVIGTLSGGLVLAGRDGRLIRRWNIDSGLPGRLVWSLSVDPQGEVLGTTSTGFFHLHASGETTLFNPRNGLKGPAVNSIRQWKSLLYAVTEEGHFRQEIPPAGEASFQAIPSSLSPSWSARPGRNESQPTRRWEADHSDSLAPVATDHATTGEIMAIFSARTDPASFYASTATGLDRIEANPDGSLVRKSFLKLPDVCTSLHEDATGRLWIGTYSKGVFTYDPALKTLLPQNDSASGEPLPRSVKLLGNDRQIVTFFEGGILLADSRGQGLHRLKDMPAITPLEVVYALNGHDIFVTYQRPQGPNTLAHGAGILSFADADRATWRELDLAALDLIGPIKSLVFTEENKRAILWLGGREGILRVDYDTIPTLAPPPAPTIRLADPAVAGSIDGNERSFPLNDHRVNLKVFTGNYVRGKDWLIQSRLLPGSGEWSAPAPRRSFEFTNLSAGTHRFEARSVNAAGMFSESSIVAFTLLPPWYRTNWAFAGYFTGFAIFASGFVQTRGRRLRRRKQELNRLVDLRTADLIKASDAKDEFLASISHEINNPMNGVIGLTESVRTEGLDADSRHKLGLLHQCASHLSSLLEDTLDFSRVQAGAFNLDSKPFDLPELMESVAALTASDSDKAGIPVEITISPGVPPRLTGDARRVRQILLNYISNALKYSQHGRVKVTVWNNAAAAGFTEVVFAVADEGPGISPEEQGKIFARFERGSGAKLGRVPGTGLGLALCKTLSEKMGGQAWLKSDAGQGSCFYFSAPFGISDEPSAPPPADAETFSEKSYCALVVDDEAYNCIALSGHLEALGILVHSAVDDGAALNLARSHAYDLVFLDYSMPGLDGPAIARAIRALPGGSADAVIFATTAFDRPEKRAECRTAGMNAFLSKPITAVQLRQALRAAIPNNRDGPSCSRPMPADPLASLRLLSAKKQTPLAEELRLYFTELETEVNHLTAALQKEDSGRACYFAHLLYGRCSFIHERDLELTLRKIEPAIVGGCWDHARLVGDEALARLTELQIRLFLDNPVAQPA